MNGSNHLENINCHLEHRSRTHLDHSIQLNQWLRNKFTRFPQETQVCTSGPVYILLLIVSLKGVLFIPLLFPNEDPRKELLKHTGGLPSWHLLVTSVIRNIPSVKHDTSGSSTSRAPRDLECDESSQYSLAKRPRDSHATVLVNYKFNYLQENVHSCIKEIENTLLRWGKLSVSGLLYLVISFLSRQVNLILATPRKLTVCLAFGVTVDYVWSSNVFYEVDVDFKTLSIPDFSTHRDYDVLPFAVISGFDDCVIAVATGLACDWLLLLATGLACDWLLLLATGFACDWLLLLSTGFAYD
ncbi:hypothetical protein F511_27362 [Dorcoceras hygrometricum]|uniref:Uncharacterized protein n=1 Tax=Dorcoceras hygrometricum TaxID=472368 RepID=A0A2Z7DE57_9LAMI|nr:hypothetical protein F511_27362 [Dorcoceras hygrometricum]